MNPYLRAATKMWWLLVIGIIAGVVAAAYIVRKHKPPTYSASTQLMVDSTDRPFLRTSITQTQQQPPRAEVTRVPVTTGATTTTSTPQRSSRSSQSQTTKIVTVPQPEQVTQQTPNTQLLVQDANLYPLVVNSDAVTAIRKRLVGDIPGQVNAQALYAYAGATGKFQPSTFPIIQINALSTTSSNATKLANGTSLALRRWMLSSQREAQVPTDQRVVLRPLVSPTTAVEHTHSRRGTAALVGLGVLCVFYAIALGIDQLRFRRRRKRELAGIQDTAGLPAPSPEA